MGKQFTVYTDDAGIKLWEKNQYFEAVRDRDAQSIFVNPVVVNAENIRHTGGGKIEIRKDGRIK